MKIGLLNRLILGGIIMAEQVLIQFRADKSLK